MSGPANGAASGGTSLSEGIVVLEFPSSRSALAEEVLLRIRAELGAAGLRVESLERGDGLSEVDSNDGETMANARGVLHLREQGALIELEAEAPGLEAPIRQSVDSSRPGIDAEVIAVRAVETLRAAVVQSVRAHGSSGTQGTAELPDSIKRFARVEEEAPVAQPPPPPAEPAPPAPKAEPARSGWGAYLDAAPLARFDTFPSAPGWGAQLGLGVSHDWLRLGARLDATFAPSSVTTTAGEIEVSEISAAARVAASLLGDSSWSLELGLAVGAVHYSIVSLPSAGYVGGTAEATSGFAELDTALGYWVSQHAGPQCAARGGWAFRAPSLRADGGEVASLGRPSLALSCGLALRF
ncbi:MAG TPA: hypothetical protein VLC09_18110 [Polyangiaceae bacterium]|nr:hypothetical protein [Polyangiaceae bacterium]